MVLQARYYRLIKVLKGHWDLSVESLIWQGSTHELLIVKYGYLRYLVYRRRVFDVESTVPLTPGLSRFDGFQDRVYG